MLLMTLPHDISNWGILRLHLVLLFLLAQWSPVVPSGPQWSPVVPSGPQWSPVVPWSPVVGVHSGGGQTPVRNRAPEVRGHGPRGRIDKRRLQRNTKRPETLTSTIQNVEREQRSLQRLQWTKWRCVCESLWKWATSKSNGLSDHCKFSLWKRQFCRSKVWRNLPKLGPALTPWFRRSADFVRWADEPTSEATVPLGLTRICGPGGLSDKIPLDFFSHCGNSGFTMGKQYNIQYESV